MDFLQFVFFGDVMKAKQIDDNLLEVAKVKQRDLFGYFYNEFEFHRHFIPGGRVLDDVRLAKIDQFMRRLLRYFVLSKLKKPSYDFFTSLPPLFALAETREGFEVLLFKEELRFLIGELRRSIVVHRGYNSSPWARMFYECQCAELLLGAIRESVRKKIKISSVPTNCSPGISIEDLKSSISSSLDKVRPNVADYMRNMKSLESSINANYKSLNLQIHRLIRAEKNLYVTTMKLLYSRDWFSAYKAPEYYFSQVSCDINCLLHSKAHKDLNQKMAGYLWKIESADEGLRVHLILFLRPDVVMYPAQFRELVGQRWARDVVANSQGGYALTWAMDMKELDIHAPQLFESNGLDLSMKIDEIVLYVVLQDFLRRYQGDTKVVAKGNLAANIKKAQNDRVLALKTKRNLKKYKHRTFAFGYGQQEFTRESAKRAQRTKKEGTEV